MHAKTTPITYISKNRTFDFRILFLSVITLVILALIILSIIPIEEKHYVLPFSLEPAQQLLRHPSDDGIYIPSLKEDKVTHRIKYWWLRIKYGKEILKAFEKKKVKISSPHSDISIDLQGYLNFPDNEKARASQLYVALPAYIAGSYEAGEPADYGYTYEISSVPNGSGLEYLLGTTIVTVDNFPPTIEKVKEMVTTKSRYNLELRTYKGEMLTITTTLHGIAIDAHYTINELWKFNDLMRFELADTEGDSGGAATAYEVFLKKKAISNKHGEFVITGAINIDGKIRSVGGVEAKTYLSIKKSIPVMFVPNGLNFSEALAMKDRMKSDIVIVPIEKLSDIEAYWNNR